MTQNHQDPSRIIDEHWYMTEYYIGRTNYHKTPRYPLTGVNIQAEHYVHGPLEDWTRGALELDGKTQFLKIPHKQLSGPVTIEMDNQTRQFPASMRRTVDMQNNNFLIEAVLRTEKGHTGGGIASKSDGNVGYELRLSDAGGLMLTLSAGNGRDVAQADRVKINDGQWHHIIAEVDRKRWRIAIYVDGKLAGQGGLQNLQPNSSLSNKADFLCGKSASGKLLAGQIDFLRVCRGTLNDAHTTIEELHAWQFDGPHLMDFNYRKPTGQGRDAGAIEATP